MKRPKLLHFRPTKRRRQRERAQARADIELALSVPTVYRTGTPSDQPLTLVDFFRYVTVEPPALHQKLLLEKLEMARTSHGFRPHQKVL